MNYTVRSGDSLSIIAKKFGQPYTSWKEIYQLNPQIGANPDKIYPGQVLTIPSSWGTGDSGQDARIQDVPVKPKTDLTWWYVGGGVLLLYMAWKKKGFKL